jgi:hypothetical protein
VTPPSLCPSLLLHWYCITSTNAQWRWSLVYSSFLKIFMFSR